MNKVNNFWGHEPIPDEINKYSFQEICCNFYTKCVKALETKKFDKNVISVINLPVYANDMKVEERRRSASSIACPNNCIKPAFGIRHLQTVLSVLKVLGANKKFG